MLIELFLTIAGYNICIRSKILKISAAIGRIDVKKLTMELVIEMMAARIFGLERDKVALDKLNDDKQTQINDNEDIITGMREENECVQSARDFWYRRHDDVQKDLKSKSDLIELRAERISALEDLLLQKDNHIVELKCELNIAKNPVKIDEDEDYLDMQTEIENMRSYLITHGLDTDFMAWNGSDKENHATKIDGLEVDIQSLRDINRRYENEQQQDLAEIERLRKANQNLRDRFHEISYPE